MLLGAISAMYIGAFIEAIPIPKPPIILKITNKVTDSSKNEGKPDPHAEIVNSIAEIIKEYLRPSLILKGPATIAPTKQPKSALPTTQPFIAASNSKYLLK